MTESTPEQDKAEVVQNLRTQVDRMSALLGELEALDYEQFAECARVFEKIALEADNLFEKSTAAYVFALLIGDE